MGAVVVLDHPYKYIFEWFNDVNPTGYGWGPIRVSYMEIEAFSRVRGLRVRPWEAEMIVDISILNIEVFHFLKNNPNLPKGYTPVGDAAGVKAVFSKLAKGS